MKNIARRWSAVLLLILVYTVTMAVLADVFEFDLSVGALKSVGQGGTATIDFGYFPDRIAAGLSMSPLVLVMHSTLLVLCLTIPAFSMTIASAIAVFVAAGFCTLYFVKSAIVSDSQLMILFVCLSAIYIAYLILHWLIVSFRRRRVNYFLRQYVPQQLADHYMNHPHEIGQVGDSREMTIMFCDIKRFTAISERLDPAVLPNWLNRYFDVVCSVVVSHGGTIDKYMGDSVMAFWGAPAYSDTHACDAMMAAREILDKVAELSNELVAEELPPIAVGIGVSTGNANVGHLGSKYRMTYTVVGDAVNTADRLQRCTGFYDLPLIVNDAATESVPEFLFRELDTVHVKGRQRFVRIFQPMCHEDEAVPNTHRQLQMHRKAMQFYRRGMWADAEALFLKLGEESGEVKFYKKYIDRLVEIQKSQPKDGGSYVVDFTQKMG